MSSISVRISLERFARKPSAGWRWTRRIAAAGLCAVALFYGAGLSAQGAYTNTLSIEAPPGAAGMRPDIALRYSSDAGNGQAGVGWSLSGFPVISRTAFGRPVSFDAHDTYSGPGGRLVDVSGTAAYYHSVATDWARYEPSGNCGNGPCMWTVRNADGSTHYYGVSSNSRIEANASTGAVLTWALSRVEDARGNAYVIEYDAQANPGMLSPALIRYNVVPGVVAYRTIEFDWESRPDVRAGASHGVAWSSVKRLRAVSVRSGGSLVRRYALTYAQSAGSGRSLLAAVQEYGSDGSAVKSTATFGWSASAALPEFIETAGDSSGSPGADLRSFRFTLADVNGDGASDILGWYDGWKTADSSWPNAPLRRVVYLSNGDGSFRLGAYDQGGSALKPNECPHIFPGEFNGDGMTDLVVMCKTLIDVGWESRNARVRRYTYLSNGDGTFREAASADGADIDWLRGEYYRNPQTADINGDGLTDLIAPNTSRDLDAEAPLYTLSTKVWIARPNGTFGLQLNRPQPTLQGVWAKMQVQFLDMNGDNFADILAVGYIDGTENALARAVMFGDGTGAFSDGPSVRSVTRKWSDYRISFVDVNSDGAPDVLALARDEQIVLFNNGRGVLGSPIVRTNDLGAQWGESVRSFADLNGDGLLDMLGYRRKGTDVFMSATAYFGTGDGGFQATELAPGSTRLDFQKKAEHAGDVNGDGRLDIVYLEPLNNGLVRNVYLAADRGQDLVTSVDNGVGSISTITYQRANLTPGVVARNVDSCGGASGVGYGQPCGVPNVSGRMLVTGQSVSDGRGANYTMSFGYYNARVYPGDYRTSTDLGFERVTATTMAGEVNATYFYQSRTHARQARLSESYTASGQLRTRTVSGAPQPYKCNEAGCQAGYSDADQLAFSLQLRPGVVETVAYDGGVAVSTTRSTPESQDAYGNALRTIQTVANRSGQIVKASCKVNDAANQLSSPRAIGFVYQESIYGDSGCTRLVSAKRTYFDHQPLGSLGARLLNTRTEQYAGSASDSGWAPTQFQHDSFGNITKETGPNGLSKTIAYDPMYAAFGVSIRDAMDRVTVSVTDHRYNVPVEIIDPDGVTTRVSLDLFGRVTETVLTDNTGRRLRKSTNEYSNSGASDGNWLRACVHHGVGWIKETCAVEFRDGLNRIYKRVTLAGDVRTETVTEYDAAGRPYRSSKPYTAGGAPAYWNTTEFDELGRPVRQTMPDGQSMAIAYDDAAPVSGALRTVTAQFPNGVRKRTHYNADEKPLQITDGIGAGAGSTVSFEYDAQGRMTASIAPNGQRVTVEYDGGGNRTRVTDPNAGVTSWTYNTTPGKASFGQVATQTRPAANDAAGTTLAVFKYDAFGRPLQETVSDGSSTTYTYDEIEYAHSYGRLTTSVHKTDGYTLTTNYSYDEFGKENHRIRTVSGPGDLAFTGAYGVERDELGRETRVLYPDGSVFEIEHDDAGRIGSLQLDGVEYANFDDYNLEGQVGTVEYRNGVITRYEYDPARGNLTNLRSDSAAGAVLDFTYRFDPVGNITRITDGVRPELSSSYSYDSLNRLASMVRNGSTFEFAFDIAGNITRKATIGANDTLTHLNLAYHAGTNRLQSDGVNSYEWSAAGNLVGRGDRSYRYTDRNMLKEVRRNGLVAVRNVYDQTGDRVVKIFQNRDGTEVRTFYVGAGYEIRERWSGPDRLAGQASKYVLGVDGAKMATVTSGQNLAEFSYDSAALNHYVYAGMMSYTLPGVVKKIRHLWLGMFTEISHALDGAANSQRRQAQALLGVALLLAFAALLLLQLRQILSRAELLREFGARQLVLAQGALVALVAFLPMQCGAVVDSAYGFATGVPHENSLIYGGPEALTGDTSMGLPIGTYFYHGDHLGSSSVVTDAKGDVITRIAYLPYGEIDHINSPGADTVTFKFTGQEYDPEAELYNYKARYYDPVIGLFTSADTMVPDATNPMDHNRYMYVRGNPVRYTDPTGHFVAGSQEWIDQGISNLLGEGWSAEQATEYMYVQAWYINNGGGTVYQVFGPNFTTDNNAALADFDFVDHESVDSARGNTNNNSAQGLICGMYYCWEAPNNGQFLAAIKDLDEKSDERLRVSINGVNTDMRGAMLQGMGVAMNGQLDGVSPWAVVIYNPSSFGDVFEQDLLRRDVPDWGGAVDLTMSVLDTLEGKVDIFAYSEGTAIAAQALRRTSSANRENVSVVAYGNIDYMPGDVSAIYINSGSGERPSRIVDCNLCYGDIASFAGSDDVATASLFTSTSSDSWLHLIDAINGGNQSFYYDESVSGHFSYNIGGIQGQCSFGADC